VRPAGVWRGGRARGRPEGTPLGLGLAGRCGWRSALRGRWVGGREFAWAEGVRWGGIWGAGRVGGSLVARGGGGAGVRVCQTWMGVCGAEKAEFGWAAGGAWEVALERSRVWFLGRRGADWGGLGWVRGVLAAAWRGWRCGEWRGSSRVGGRGGRGLVGAGVRPGATGRGAAGWGWGGAAWRDGGMGQGGGGRVGSAEFGRGPVGGRFFGGVAVLVEGWCRRGTWAAGVQVARGRRCEGWWG